MSEPLQGPSSHMSWQWAEPPGKTRASQRWELAGNTSPLAGKPSFYDFAKAVGTNDYRFSGF